MNLRDSLSCHPIIAELVLFHFCCISTKIVFFTIFLPFGTLWYLFVPLNNSLIFDTLSGFWSLWNHLASFGTLWCLLEPWYLLVSFAGTFLLHFRPIQVRYNSNFWFYPQFNKECGLVIGLECKALCNKWVWLSLALLLWSEKYFLTTKMYSNDIPTTTRTSSRWQSGRGWRPQNFCIPTVALALVKTSVSCRVSTNEMRPFGDWTQQGKKSNWKWLTIDTCEKASKKTQSLKVITILEVYIILGNVHNF